MIIYEETNELLGAYEQTLLTPIDVDAVGGGGLPAVFRYRYPGLFHAYHWAKEKHVFENDGLFVYDATDRKIACLPTRQHRRYTQQEKLEYLEESLMVVATSYQRYGITSLAINEIGYGDAELPWELVKPIVLRCFDAIELPVGIYRGAVPA